MHWARTACFILNEGVTPEPGGAGAHTAAAAPAPPGEIKVTAYKFGRMFWKWGEDIGDGERRAMAEKLIELGTRMGAPAGGGAGANAAGAEPSVIPAGYTYLGQFIAHEITFHKTGDLKLEDVEPDSMRSPNMDLDSLYGKGPGDAESRKFFEEGNPARLKVGRTTRRSESHPRFDNDLPRVEEGEAKGAAIIGDPRNDENLAVAQTHVAFIKFHNRVVDDLAGGPLAGSPPGELFEAAKAEVIRHFQWIVLKDYLPRIVDGDVLRDVIHNPRWRPEAEGGQGLFMPLEFSAAAFRIGHSMVRLTYDWNQFQQDASLNQLFANSKFGGDLGGLATLDSDWVIDWKRFFDFKEFDRRYPYALLENPPQQPWKRLNMAGRIDTAFDLDLEMIAKLHLGQASGGQPAGPGNFNDQKSLAARNLMRGFSFGLPCGEDVAAWMKREGWLREGQELMTREELLGGPHGDLLDAPPLGGRTPLWFYVLKEAREKGKGGKLGCVGSRIVAETLVGLIRNSEYSILRRAGGGEPAWELSGWRPAYARRQGGEPVTFEMADLLIAADAVDPLGEHLSGAKPSPL